MAAGNRSVLTQTGLSSTTGFQVWYPNLTATPFSVTVSAAVNSTNAAYSLEFSNDYTGSSAFTSTAATWYASSGITAATTNAFMHVSSPFTAMRINSSAGSSQGTITATFVQA